MGRFVNINFIIIYIFWYYFDYIRMLLTGLISRGRVRHYPCAGWKGFISSGRMSLPVGRAARFEHSATVV